VAEYQCPCGCGLNISVRRACCTPAYNRLPPPLRRHLESTYVLADANPAARRRAFAAVAEWLRANPPSNPPNSPEVAGG
jgi:hypothetical protein